MPIPTLARRFIATFGQPLAALVVSLALVALALAALGANPGLTFAALANGAFGNWVALTDTLVKATPLVFTGLTVSVAFSGALWNIGGEGQLLAGALAATACGIHLGDWPRPLAIAMVLCAGALRRSRVGRAHAAGCARTTTSAKSSAPSCSITPRCKL